MAPAAQPKNEIKALLATFGSTWRTVAAFSAVSNLLMLAPAIYMLQVYDRVLASRNEYTLLMLTALVIGLYALMGLVEWVRSLVIVRVADQIDAAMNQRVFNAAFEQSLRGSGANAGQAISDFTTLRQFSTGPGLFAFMDAPWFPVYLAVIYMFDWRLGVFATVGALVLIMVAWTNERLTRQPLDEANKAANQASQMMTNQFRNSEVIESMGMLPALRKRWYGVHALMMKEQRQASESGAATGSTSKALRLGMQSGVLGLGALLVISGDITPGMMIAASILLGRALAPVDALIGVSRQFSSVRAAYQRLDELLRQFAQRVPGMSLPAPKGQVSFEGVVGMAPGGQVPVVKGVSFTVSPGDVLGIIGPSGSGKSTLARLMVGVWPAVQGKVRLDGADVYQWNKDELGPSLGYLPQDIELFSGSISDNIARFGGDDPAGVVAAAQMAGVHELILQQPKGYDTVLGEQGGGLSGGQKQRIALARAVFGDPALIVLDEPNSNLDDVGQQALAAAVARLKNAGRTVVVITHSKTILAETTHIAVMKDGMLQSYGKTAEVLGALSRPAGSPALTAVVSGKGEQS